MLLLVNFQQTTRFFFVITFKKLILYCALTMKYNVIEMTVSINLYLFNSWNRKTKENLTRDGVHAYWQTTQNTNWPPHNLLLCWWLAKTLHRVEALCCKIWATSACIWPISIRQRKQGSFSWWCTNGERLSPC